MTLTVSTPDEVVLTSAKPNSTAVLWVDGLDAIEGAVCLTIVQDGQPFGAIYVNTVELAAAVAMIGGVA